MNNIIAMNQIKILQDLYSFLGEPIMDTWLDGLNYSQAFVVCVGAGPWRKPRREKVQGEALQWLGDKDLFNVGKYVNCFPLVWQNKMVNYLINFLQNGSMTMEFFCNEFIRHDLLKDYFPARKLVYLYSGKPSGTKVLSLFCRDKLKVESFPIDRHVKRILQENNLPIKEDDMIELCKSAGLDPRKLATAFVKTGNVENPNWGLTNNYLSL